MSPETHLLTSWIIAVKFTDNPRDCRLATLAGILPDLDGAGVVIDLARESLGFRPTMLYAQYHHWLLHGVAGGILIAAVLACFARRRWRVALLALLLFHLHLLCDLAGSRGPSPVDLWPIFYFGPLARKPMWLWHGQWRLDGWFNRYFTAALFLWALWLAAKYGYSFVGVFSKRLDRIFAGTLVKWRAALKQEQAKPAGTSP